MNRTKQQQAPQISDFSAALLNAGASADAAAGRAYEDELQAMLNQQAGPDRAGESGHLSKVLKNIRDHGPARPRRSRKPRAVRQQKQQDVVTRLSGEARAASPQPSGASEAGRQAAPVSPPAAAEGGWRQSLPAILLLVAIAALAAMHFDTRNELNRLVASQQFAEQGSKLSMDTALDSQQQINAINQAVTALGSQLAALGEQLQQRQRDVVSPQQLAASMGKLEAQLGALSEQQRDALATLDRRIGVLERHPAQAGKTAAAKTTGKTGGQGTAGKNTVVATGAWSVNLAALSSRQQARAAMQRLQGAGVTPMIEEIELRGKKMYRLRVDGFASRQAAGKFVSQARRYGFEKGWIRKG